MFSIICLRMSRKVGWVSDLNVNEAKWRKVCINIFNGAPLEEETVPSALALVRQDTVASHSSTKL